MNTESVNNISSKKMFIIKELCTYWHTITQHRSPNWWRLSLQVYISHQYLFHLPWWPKWLLNNNTNLWYTDLNKNQRHQSNEKVFTCNSQRCEMQVKYIHMYKISYLWYLLNTQHTSKHVSPSITTCFLYESSVMIKSNMIFIPGQNRFY